MSAIMAGLAKDEVSVMPKEYHVFLSYSRSDAEMMRRVSEDLRGEGFRLWNDEQLEPGTDSWKTAIQNALENSATVVVLLSPDAKKSEWIERELDYARAQQVPIIPVIIRGDTQSAVPFLLISVQRADMRRDYTAGFQALVGALCAMLKLPDICADQPEAASALDQVQASIPVYQGDALPGAPVQFAGRLRIWNPLDYVKLVGLYLFNPVGFYTYEPESSRALAVWFASTLLWLPLAINSLAYRLADVPLWGFDPQPLAVLPSWLILVAWLLTGLIGQVHFEVRTGLRAFLRGPMQIATVGIGLAAAVVYVGTAIYAHPPLETRGGLVYLLASQPQQMLIIAGGLSVFAGAIIANNLARGFASWLGLWMALGFLAWYGVLLYIPIGENIAPLLQPDASSTDVRGVALMIYSGVICCAGSLLFITATTIGGALRRRQVGRLNFLLLVMLIAAYVLFAWAHLVGSAS
jgi:hypothetical protein